MRRIYLDNIGHISRYDNYWYPAEIYFKYKIDSFLRMLKDKRHKHKTGVEAARTFVPEFSVIEYIYETICEYLEQAGRIVDLDDTTECLMLNFGGQKYTERQLCQMLLQVAEYILCDIDNIKVYGRYKKEAKENIKYTLLNNPYYTKYNKWFDELDWQQTNKVLNKFWAIWNVLRIRIGW